MEIKLGEKVRDKVTGFSGILTARCHYLTGRNRIMIERLDDDGNPRESWLDEDRIEPTVPE